MRLNQYVETIHATARAKGWWDAPRSPLDVHMLIVSEIAEATEEARKDTPPFLQHGQEKPEGEAVELADAVIRIMDYFGHKGWNLEQVLDAKLKYNETRAYRHGGKKY